MAESCTCPDIDVSTALDDPADPPTIKGLDRRCPVHGKAVPPVGEIAVQWSGARIIAAPERAWISLEMLVAASPLDVSISGRGVIWLGGQVGYRALTLEDGALLCERVSPWPPEAGCTHCPTSTCCSPGCCRCAEGAVAGK